MAKQFLTPGDGMLFTGFCAIACISLYKTIYCRREAAVSIKLSSSWEKTMVRLSPHQNLSHSLAIAVIIFHKNLHPLMCPGVSWVRFGMTCGLGPWACICYCLHVSPSEWSVVGSVPWCQHDSRRVGGSLTRSWCCRAPHGPCWTRSIVGFLSKSLMDSFIDIQMRRRNGKITPLHCVKPVGPLLVYLLSGFWFVRPDTFKHWILSIEMIFFTYFINEKFCTLIWIYICGLCCIDV